MTAKLWCLWRDQRGQDMIEYALVGAMVASIAMAIVPEMSSIVMHVGEVLASITQACAQFTTG
jgi:Flp pilus assembly pilin Flp